MRKRAQSTVQYNWIFVMIAGAVILGFFVTLVFKQRESSQQQATAQLVSRMEALMITAKTSTGKATPIPIRNVDFVFNCEDMIVGNEGVAEIGNKVLFTPNRIQGDGLILWAQPWKVPYKVTNFLYMTNQEVKYVFIGDTNEIKELYEDLPPLLNKELIIDSSSFNSIRFANENKLRIICQTCDSSMNLGEFSKLNPSEISMIEITTGLGTDYGGFNYYKHDGSSFGNQMTDSVAFFGRAALYGAIFAEDLELYECNMQDAFDNLQLVNGLYILRTQKMGTHPDLIGNCKAHYNGALDFGLKEIEQASEIFSSTNLNRIYDAAGSLEEGNKRAQGDSCPVIY